MALLWSAGAPLTPGEVQRHLARNLAYTTVMTTLARLYAKGQVTRAKRGRAFAYTPVQRAEDHAAQAMTDLLGNGDDPTAVLSRFVERLRPQEEQVLRRLLERSQPPKD
jgi:predicted transcriptional regulator